MKIAVCMSGESRTFEKCAASVKHFIECDPSNEVYYFGHTWTQNSWKIFGTCHDHTHEYEVLDRDDLSQRLMAHYNFTGLVIDQPHAIRPNADSQEILHIDRSAIESTSNYMRPHQWCPMSYSNMISNFEKQKYEIKNNMQFDLVLKVRPDQCFHPEYRLSKYIPDTIRNDVLYCEPTYFPREFRQQAINDIFYFGSSKVMDTIETFYRVYHNGNFFKMMNAHYYDSALKHVGYGVMLYKWAMLKNIHPHHMGQVFSHILRQHSLVTNSITEYDILTQEASVWGHTP